MWIPVTKGISFAFAPEEKWQKMPAGRAEHLIFVELHTRVVEGLEPVGPGVGGLDHGGVEALAGDVRVVVRVRLVDPHRLDLLVPHGVGQVGLGLLKGERRKKRP